LDGLVVAIVELDPADEAGLREYHALEVAAHVADRPYAVRRTYPALAQKARRPSPWYHRVLLVARDEGRLVGTAELGLTQQDNLHLAELEVNVHPQARRRGVGSALHDEAVRRGREAGRTTFLGEAHTPIGDEASPASAFATALGYAVVHREHHQVLDLPLPGSLERTLPRAADGYELVTWRDRAPDDVVEAYATMHTQMGRDVPSGEVDHEPNVIDVAKIRTEEEFTAVGHTHLVAAARRTSDGVFAGYTVVVLPRGADYAVQNDTMVMPAHRGHGLGMLLKAVMLRSLAAEHPECRVVHTWNAVDNAPMQHINRELGFRPVEVLLDMQRKDRDR
jgi:GNAT superfamily N-acetyltransferase